MYLVLVHSVIMSFSFNWSTPFVGILICYGSLEYSGWVYTPGSLIPTGFSGVGWFTFNFRIGTLKKVSCTDLVT